MSPISAKNLLCLLAFTSLLLTCSREGDEPLWVPETHLGSKDYNGGTFPVWIRLKDPVPMKDSSSITWRAGKNAQIAYRKHVLNSNYDIIIDTAVFHWETPPEPTMMCVTVDGNCEEIEVYRDTIFAIVNGVESAPIIIEIKNILPRVKSLKVGGLMPQPGDTNLIIAAHPGERLEIKLELEQEKVFSKNSPRVDMPLVGSMRLLKSPSDNDLSYLWEWIAPNYTKDTIIDLKIGDSGGKGERIYKIHLISYYDFGSVWVASENEIAKFSPNGSRVLSIRDGNFSYISDIAVHSNTEKLFVVDQYKNTLSIYDTYGTLISRDSTSLRNPTSVAVDIEGLYVWIADSNAVATSSSSSLRSSSSAVEAPLEDKYRFRLRAFDFAAGTLGGVAHEFYFSGAIRGLSADQFDRTRLWFTTPETDTVGFVRYDRQMRNRDAVIYVELSKGKWNRPSMVSLNPNKNDGLAWIADSSRIIAIDTSGNQMAVAEGFGFVSAVSASGNLVWASDILKGKVYQFKGPFDASPRALDLIRYRDEVDESGGFSQPSFVSAYIADDGGAWIMDRGNGEVVRVNNSRERIFAGTGLRPLIGKTIQKVE